MMLTLLLILAFIYFLTAPLGSYRSARVLSTYKKQALQAWTSPVSEPLLLL